MSDTPAEGVARQELDRLRSVLAKLEGPCGADDRDVAYQVCGAAKAYVSALEAAAPAPLPAPADLQTGNIVLDEPYLHHLREAAYDWAIESIESEPSGSRRACIVLGRNVLCLVDELRAARLASRPVPEGAPNTDVGPDIPGGGAA